MFISAHYSNKEKNVSISVCGMSNCRKYFAIADMVGIGKRSNISKPIVISKVALIKQIKNDFLTLDTYQLPAEMTYSDDALREISRETWIKKRDKKWAAIAVLTTPELVHQYLFGGGIGEEIQRLIASDNTGWKSRGAYYNALNRFIVLGQTKNALLPVGLKHTGSNYLEFEKISHKLVKRGRGGKNNEGSRSKTRGITKTDKRNIKKTLAYFKKNGLKFLYLIMFQKYQEIFETTEFIRKSSDDRKGLSYIPFNEIDSISFNQFYYHAKKIVSRADLLKIKYGNLMFEKDFAPRQGVAWDGVVGATHRYEIDATVLDVYVRYPYDVKNRYSMGRPILYLVICVYSTMIVGFYLGFDGPNWEGAAAALVNACSDKVHFAKKYGIFLAEDDWPCHHIPQEITIDNGPEYLKSLITSILRSELGVTAINVAAVYRGDAKGTVERKFGVINDQIIHFVPGAIFKDLREEQHPSNAAFYDYDALIKILIHEFIYHNNSANRAARHNWQAAVDGTDITPKAIYKHSLRTEMEGGRPTTIDDTARVQWAFLPEEQATVSDTCILFKGLEYDCEYARSAGWYSTAKFHGRFKIPVKSLKNSTSIIWHKTANGEFVELQLKNTNNENPFFDQHWEMVQNAQFWYKDAAHSLEQDARLLRAAKRESTADIDAQMAAQIACGEPNERKSMQPNIKERQEVQKKINHANMTAEVRNNLNIQQAESTTPDEYLDLDDELF